MRKGLGFHARHSPGGAFSPLSLFTGGVQGAWYDPSDSTTLFSDRAGTTPCGTPGGGSVVPVGAMLDKRAAGYSVFFDGTGDNLETPNSAAFQFGTGDFTVEGWIYVTGALTGYRIIAQCAANSSWSTGWSLVILNDRLNLWLNGGNIALSGAGTILANTWQHVAVTRSGTTVTLWIGGSSVATATNSDNLVPTRAVSIGAETSPFAHPFQGYISNVRVVKGTAVYTGAFTPAGPLSPITGTSLLTCGTSWTGNPAITKNGDARVDGLNPFTASPVGNHAIAANDTTARPELRARVNLLTYSEDLTNSIWVATLGTTKNSATTFTIGTGALAEVYQLNVPAGGTARRSFTASVTISVASGTALFRIKNTHGGVVDNFSANLTATTTPTRFSFTVTNSSSAGDGLQILGIVNASDASSNGKQFILHNAQLTDTNEFPANTYQRIVDANTYDAVGFPRYLVANGTSSAMSTPGNVTLGVANLTQFIGLRKQADGSFPVITQFGGTRAIELHLSQSTGTTGYTGVIYTTGSSVPYVGGATPNNAAPVSNVLTVSADASQTVFSNALQMRVNGVSQTLSALNSGVYVGGTFGSAPLRIGARDTTSLFLNGNIYSLIVVGSAVSAGNISSTEQWVAGKVGITI